MKMEGYVIVPPIFPWDETNKEKIWLDMSYISFGKTPVESWNRFIGPTPSLERSVKIQRYYDFGYRIKKASLEIYEND